MFFAKVQSIEIKFCTCISINDVVWREVGFYIDYKVDKWQSYSKITFKKRTQMTWYRIEGNFKLFNWIEIKSKFVVWFFKLHLIN